MAKELKIENEEVIFTMDKNSSQDIIGKIITTPDGVAVDFRIYYYTKDDPEHTEPKHTAKGLWLDPDLALEVGIAMQDAAQKAIEQQLKAGKRVG
jgi:hypothetical protein